MVIYFYLVSAIYISNLRVFIEDVFCCPMFCIDSQIQAQVQAQTQAAQVQIAQAQAAQAQAQAQAAQVRANMAAATNLTRAGMYDVC